MKSRYTFKEQWEMIKPVWRILLIVSLTQIVGGVVAISFEKYENPLVDFWFGGAIATFSGFLLGAMVHQISSESKIKDHLPVVIFIGLISLALTVGAILMPLEQIAKHL